MRLKSYYIVTLIFLLLGFFMYYGNLGTHHFLPQFADYENRLQDTFLQWKPENIDSRISIIAIDEESIKTLGAWPWPRSYHAQLINTLEESKPAVIAFDIEFDGESSDPEEDAALTDAIKNSGKVVLASHGEFESSTKAGKLQAVQYYEPLSAFSQYASLGHINVLAGNDGIIRYFLDSFEYKNLSTGVSQTVNSIDYQIVQQYNKSTGNKNTNKAIPHDAWNRVFIDYAGGSHSYEVIPYISVLNGDIQPGYFKDKIVLVGPYTVGMQDSFFSPMDRKTPIYGIEVHANIVQQILHGSYKSFAAYPLNLLILLVFGAAGYYLCSKLRPLISLAAVAAIAVLYIFAARFIYSKGFILTVFYPLALITAIYFIMLAYRYIEELLERKRITGIFGRYVAPQVVNQILKGGEEGLRLGGTRREITALFVDIRGFTPMSEKAQPEEVVSILNDYLDLCARSIFKYGGTLDKFIGDATMAIYNAPLDLKDHALMAVKTAWAMKEGSAALQKVLEEKYGRSVQFGIGVNTGPAVVGNIGSKSRMDYTAIGDTVNTAARLESNAKPGQILISQSTYELVKDHVKASSLGEINVKGKTQGIPVYQLEGVVEENEK